MINSKNGLRLSSPVNIFLTSTEVVPVSRSKVITKIKKVTNFRDLYLELLIRPP